MKNLLIGYGSVYGDELSHWLINNDIVDFCYNTSKSFCFEEEGGRIVNFNQHLARLGIYEEVFDFNNIPALNESILNAMLPYESMIIKLGLRRTNFPIVDYEREKMNYHKHLRFWNYILDKYNINYIFFEEIPHQSFSYTIYALAKIKKINVLLFGVSSIPSVRTIGSSIENMGENIKEYYENNMKNVDISDAVLEENVKEFYEKCKYYVNNCEDKAEKNKQNKTDYLRVKKLLFGEKIGNKKYKEFNERRKYIEDHKKSIYPDEVWFQNRLMELEQFREDNCRINYFLRNKCETLAQYNDKATYPNFNCDYIFFSLQLSPEETTIPRAGVFSEQYTSIQIIARAAKKHNISVYVKEHYVQPFRDKLFYNLLRSIDNVVLIRSDVDSRILMKNSIAVSTQTGTCILESALLGKYVLVFGEGNNWKGIPSAICISSEEEADASIVRILDNEISFSQEEIYKYFYSIQKNTINCYLQANFEEQRKLDVHKKSLDRIEKYVESWVNEL